MSINRALDYEGVRYTHTYRYTHMYTHKSFILHEINQKEKDK